MNPDAVEVVAKAGTDVAVKIDRGLYDKAKLVAFRRRITMAELLTDMLRQPLERAYALEVKKLTQEEAGG